MRATTLFPLTGRASSSDAVWGQTLSLVKQWRIRLVKLQRAGWLRKFKLYRARNCQPAFAVTSPASFKCGLRLICPFCYARSVLHTWEHINTCVVTRGGYPTESNNVRRARVITLTPNERARTNHHLVAVWLYRDIPFDNLSPVAVDAYRTLLEKLVTDRATRLRRLPSVGSFIRSCLSLTDCAWHVDQYELHLVPEDVEFPAPRSGSLWRYPKLTKRSVFCAVSRVCSYHKWLLHGSAMQVAMLLNAQAGLHEDGHKSAQLRLSSFSGCFRNKS